ncbi:MAG: hypothetical protein GY864_02515 [Desulfobacterales bacterium]|nr:hypothetical protein [Desulfobacterales bacterium]
MATIQAKGDKIRQAVKWISEKLQEDEKSSITVLIQEVGQLYNLSPKDEEFLRSFYKKEID